jgi:aspartyl-tRNA(Asn)/glutamyl-tRNA(Gln) amidotransferase subunit C
MRLSREEVEHIAELAKLGLTEEEVEQFSQQLSAILEYAQRLQELDTQVITLQNVMRPDEVRPSFAREDILANAPAVEKGCFKVHAVLE